MSPVIDYPHGCPPPSTWRYRDSFDWVWSCGARWYLAWFRSADGQQMLGPSWILEARD